ncbi:DUF3526 domain-containing protein [Leeuwenhoekiella marinoflava]|uniref:ABC-2 type transport system permease protein n=2 Tax=Leeuwenhoekiella marinoflava TaxID=988 RepID=A0A4Q0P5U4_9FLAO|nr:DUF3526 domain-containing protein [Leeuwenhoekiella marinoflava]RXG21009.1 ABC-2 type transport system permease protein [Leeuwenhoekiella marinoflava]SHG05719.1 ABC-2 type transport system permease protein [Leeuwenhoekiella marinoflava DSM 3653]
MNTAFFRLFAIEYKRFARNPISILGFAVVFTIGVYAIFHGKNTIAQQKETIETIAGIQKEELDKNKKFFSDDLSHFTYYQFYYTQNEPSKWAAFSIGQRDVNNYSLKVRILAVEGQLYDTELANPMTLLSGNLDLSFLFVVLIPLLIISLCFNLISSERESGVWAVVASQPYSLSKIIFLKFSVRFLAVLGLSLLLLLAALWLLELPFDADFGLVFVLILGYELFWFGLVNALTLLKKNSNYNAVMLLGVWLFLVVLLPSLGNVLINRFIAIPEAFSTTVTQREAYHEKWDMPRREAMEPFYDAYPQYRQFSIPEDIYSNGWYYAMQYVADKAAEKDSKLLFEKLKRRQVVSKKLSYFIPSLLLQNTFNSIAETDLKDHINYLESVKKYHKEISEFFYPYLFKGNSIDERAWEDFPEFESDSNEALSTTPK